MLKASNNPNAVFNSLLMSNPQLKQMNDLVKNSYNGDGQAAFYDAARAKGMNDEQIKEFLNTLS